MTLTSSNQHRKATHEDEVMKMKMKKHAERKTQKVQDERAREKRGRSKLMQAAYVRKLNRPGRRRCLG